MDRIKKIFIAIVLLLFTSISVAAMTPDEAVKEKLYAQYNLDKLSYEIEVLHNNIKLPDVDPVDMTIKQLTQKDPLGLFTVYVTVFEDGEKKASGQVRTRVRKFSEVIVTSDKIGRHDILDMTNCSVERKEVTSIIDQPLTKFEDLDNLRSQKHLSKGTIITTGNAEKIPDIEVGDNTTIVVDNGLFQITTEGVALETGSKGDVIRVKNSATRKVLLAKVKNSSEVVVEQ